MRIALQVSMDGEPIGRSFFDRRALSLRHASPMQACLETQPPTSRGSAASEQVRSISA
jgi:hypothetical protein